MEKVKIKELKEESGRCFIGSLRREKHQVKSFPSTFVNHSPLYLTSHILDFSDAPADSSRCLTVRNTRDFHQLPRNLSRVELFNSSPNLPPANFL